MLAYASACAKFTPSFRPLPTDNHTAVMESCWTRCLPASVNRQLLPLKAHYFLYLAGQACVSPYLAVIGRQIGINAAMIAVIFSLTPLAAVVINPLCGFVIDRTQNATAVIVFLQAILVASYGVVFFSPSINAHTDSSFTGYINCNSSQLMVSNASSASCVVSGAYESAPISCNLTVIEDGYSVNVDVTSASDTLVNLSDVSKICGNVSVNESVASETYANLRCPCDATPYEGKFWIYTISVFIAWASSATMYTVTDAAVCELLGDNVNAFGRQRLWGTVSWGVVSPLIGFLIDEASDSSYTNYKPGFYLFAAIMALNILLICCMPRLRTADLSVNFLWDIVILFCDVEIVLFTAWTFIVGALMGVLWSFSTWYLEDLHASKLMIGLTNTVMSLCVEVPLFFISKTILERVGYFFSYTAALLAFSIKFIGYSYLVNPWYGLIVDIVGGVTFPLAYSAMTVFAKRAATPGTAASMMCILGSAFEGLGIAAGNLLGGMSIDKIGARLTFRYLGYASAGCAILCTLTYLCLRHLGSSRLDATCRGYSPIGEARPQYHQGSGCDKER
ncbi:major facilitator superfamily domain-containing protein 6 isoform X2 [Dermacentor silvarum]|uniref:major facilitator superfamily domain-containing protein 6 isoform X2 n=1 Tax=Dermacentor silvarum TaxID=543639 RepID=UPI001898F364|nr:major facilitator superfamily domain-containing protein 6 isoform X2 [Dermacentor silvarum]